MPIREPPSLIEDDRGLATGIIGFIAMIVIAALMFTLMDPAADMIFSMSTAQADSAQAHNAIELRKKIWDAMLYFALFLAAIFVIARAVFESRSPG